MNSAKKKFYLLRQKQQKALRHPCEVICGNPFFNGLSGESLLYNTYGNFADILYRSNITLLITREYEHLVLALHATKKGITQSFLHLPHPNGIAVNRKKNRVYVASTRNPNKIVELSVVSNLIHRSEMNHIKRHDKLLTPSREKYYAGSYYFHDLAFIGNQLYANSVGKNGIVPINFDTPDSEEIVWSPLHKKLSHSNYLQLNSIAAGKDIASSFFTASAEKPGDYKPGDLRFPVDKKGVIFSGRDGAVVARGLTRPHSAKLHKGLLWVNNSGYGETGYIDNGNFVPVFTFPGWTRGLSFIDDIAFIGVSKIIPKYKIYAPGLSIRHQQCAVYAVNISTREILGRIEWEMGNQIYGIDWISADACIGFPFKTLNGDEEYLNEFYFRHAFNY
ncbi:MAG: DUF4915 domain-containing protein [Chitinophagales bacterium]|nr:TIGR03032 family protein [Chitinophagales bacterium]MDW8273829.1 DUF4915 domain-containing protein [Chitinophagales bacterium]